MERLNLHGLSREEALERVRAQIRWCVEHGREGVDIIHGKGKHSERVPVIKQEIRRWLKEEERGLRAEGYEVIYGEDEHPAALDLDEGHTLVVRADMTDEYPGGRKAVSRQETVFSEEGRWRRKAAKRNWHRS